MKTPSRDGGLRSRLLLAAAAVVIFGNSGCAIETEVGGNVIDRPSVATVPANIRHAVDLLLVVDDRATDGDLRGETVGMWRDLRGHLAHAEGGFPDVHIGVVSSDVGVGAAIVPGCTATGGDGALIADSDGHRWIDVTADDPASDDALRARLTLPDAGCPYDQPIAAMTRALDGEQPANDGFRRVDAALVVVLVAGDDDCSVADPAFWANDVDAGGPVSPFRCFREAVVCSDGGAGELNGCRARSDVTRLVSLDDAEHLLDRLVPDASARVVTGVIGDTAHIDVIDGVNGPSLSPECTGKTARTLYPGVRLRDFVRGVGGVVAPSCDQPVAAAAAPTGPALRQALGNHCVRQGVADRVLDEPGVQPDCTVDAVDALGVRTSIPVCENPDFVFGEAGPCWALRTDVDACGDYPSQLALTVNWGGASPMTQPKDVVADVRCVLAGEPVIR